MSNINKSISASKRKKERIKINNINDFKEALDNENYKIDYSNDEEFKKYIKSVFKIDDDVIEDLYNTLEKDDITYRANDVKEFIDYIEKINIFENNNKKFSEVLNPIDILEINRIEYDRIFTGIDDVSDILEEIQNTADNISDKISEIDKIKLIELEEEIHENHVYAKDIELVKKMVSVEKENTNEIYNEKTKTRSIVIKMPNEINSTYIKAKKGSVEYYEHLNSNIPRLYRLIKNIDKYMTVDDKIKCKYSINQSEVLQDSINMAVAIFDNKEFKAISGSDEIDDYCMAPHIDKAVFKSHKVNKLGELGKGYQRVNDSEKKIFEAIHREIEAKNLNDYGDITLYSKWEPCLSCYDVINQFIKKYPKINVQVKYLKKYGEK